MSEKAGRIGFIGLGIMGCPMALNLLRAGFELFLHSRSGVPAVLTSAGGKACGSPRELAESSDIIIVMVPDTADVDAVLFGENGVAAGLAAGKLIIDMSSISPIATRRFAGVIAAQDCDYLDAPVSGGEAGAREARLSIMVGGSAEAFSRAMPLFQAMGKKITHVGASGAGQTAKVANQIIVALTIEAVAEALVFASRSGADPGKVREALMGGFADSRILEVHGKRMIDRTFEPGFRIGLHRKDLRIALDAADTLNLSLPNTAICQQMLSACVADGLGDADHSALVRAVEHMAAHEIGRPEAPLR